MHLNMHLKLVSELIKLYKLGYPSHNLLVKDLKFDLRRLERESLFNKDKHNAFTLYSLLNHDKGDTLLLV